MNDKKVILQSILDQGMLPLFYWDSPTVSLEVIRALYRAGVRALEYTNRGPAALENFRFLKKELSGEAADLYLGIGTVKTAAEAEAFIKAGADFIVSPIVNGEVAALAEKAGAEVINFDKEDVYERLNRITKGRGPDSCIDAVGCEASGHGGL